MYNYNKILLPNDLIDPTQPRRFETYEALEREQEGILLSEREDAQAKIENERLQPGQRFAYYWSPSMSSSEKVTTMARWDELTQQDRALRYRIRSQFVSNLSRSNSKPY